MWLFVCPLWLCRSLSIWDSLRVWLVRELISSLCIVKEKYIVETVPLTLLDVEFG